jgi:hypothetical protein
MSSSGHGNISVRQCSLAGNNQPEAMRPNFTLRFRPVETYARAGSRSPPPPAPWLVRPAGQPSETQVLAFSPVTGRNFGSTDFCAGNSARLNSSSSAIHRNGSSHDLVSATSASGLILGHKPPEKAIGLLRERIDVNADPPHQVQMDLAGQSGGRVARRGVQRLQRPWTSR